MTSKQIAKVRPIAAVLKEFEGYYKESVAKKYPDLRVREERLRVSGFPYCALKHAYKRLTAHEVVNDTDMSGYYYVEVGTVAHSIIQEFLGRNGKMYGQWKCLDKACKGFRALSCRNVCPVCKGRMEYEELTVTAFKNVSGHIDGVYKDAQGKYWIIDYKTCSVRIIDSQGVNRTLPYGHNMAQIRAYVALIEECFDIKIAGWILLYVARDSPMTVLKAEGAYMSQAAKAKYLRRIQRWDSEWDEVLAIKDLQDLKAVVAKKPCKDKDFYDKHYESYNPCPLSRGELCFQPERLDQLIEMCWLSREEYLQLQNCK